MSARVSVPPPPAVEPAPPKALARGGIGSWLQRRFPRLRDTVGSLRFQLSAWNTAALLCMVVVTMIGVREGMRFTMFSEADAELLEDLHEVVLTIEQLYPSLPEIHAEFERKVESHAHRELFIRLFDEKRELIWSSRDAPPVQTPIAGLSVVDRPYKAGSHRVVNSVIVKPGMPRWTVRVGESFASLEARITQLTEWMLVVGVVTVVLAPLGGYWLAGRATRPLQTIIALAERMQPSQMSERLPSRGTGDELDRLSKTINGLLDRLARYVAQNREFTANAAHDLRSPLAAMHGAIDVALNARRSVEEYQELLEELLDESQMLGMLVNQLLLLAETDSGELRLSQEPVLMNDVVRRACDMFEGVAEAAGVSLTVDLGGPAYVLGDAARLRQVINNLVDNAIKFSRRGDAVHVRLTRAPSHVELVVADSGPGIPSEDLPHVFDRFYRSDKARQRGDEAVRGSGLGLSICSSLIKAHGGTIRIDSAPNAGTTVVVALPAARDPHAAAAM